MVRATTGRRSPPIAQSPTAGLPSPSEWLSRRADHRCRRTERLARHTTPRGPLAPWTGPPHAASIPAYARVPQVDPQRQAPAGGSPAIRVEAPLPAASLPCACLVSPPPESGTIANRAVHRPAGDPRWHDGARIL